MLNFKGLTTGIGSLPHQNPEAALDLIFKYCPQIPFWPQLPKRDKREGMITQFSENLPCLKLNSAGHFFDPQDKEKELERFYERLISEDVEYFKITPEFALGLHRFSARLERQALTRIEAIKCQVVGPFTFSAGINDDQGIALLHNNVFMQAFLKGLAMKALWQINFFKKFFKKIIIFFDEPYLGCFGSAYTPINREEVVTRLNELTQMVKKENVFLGLHCCGNTDWSIFTEINNLDIISFDAFSFMERVILYAENLKSFLKKGGLLCWGIVPTQEFSGKETPTLLMEKIKKGIDMLVKKGLDKELLIENMLLSPACGLGALEIKSAEPILRLLTEVSFFVKNL